MTRKSLRRAAPARILQSLTLVALILLAGLFAGCRQQARQPRSSGPINASHIEIVAWFDADSPCQEWTAELLETLEKEHPERLDLRIVDTGTSEGRERREERGLDAVAIEIDGYTTVEWGEGDSRRIVTFKHPPGFTWAHEDLRAAVEAALQGDLRPASPAEAEGVRLMDISVRGQSIRVGDQGDETGQLVIQDQIVLELTHSRDDLLPGQRVTIAADALTEVLQDPFTPNQLGRKRVDDGVALMAGETQLLLATKPDAAEEHTSPARLAERWRVAVREALIDAALQRVETPAPDQSADPATPQNEASHPLLPPGEQSAGGE